MTLEIIKFASEAEADELGEENNIGGIGGDWEPLEWQEYIEQWCDEVKPYFEILRKKILEDKIKNGGFWHQEKGCPIFNDGKAISMTMRAWGDLMAAIWNTEEGTKDNYCKYAWEH